MQSSTLQDRAARLKRAQKFKEEQEAYTRSHDGVKASDAAHQLLIGDLKAKSEIVGCRVRELKYENILMLLGDGVVLTVRYERRYANSLDGTVLTAEFYDGVPHLPSLIPHRDKPRVLDTWKFTFQLVGPGRSAWVGPDKEHLSESLAEFSYNIF